MSHERFRLTHKKKIINIADQHLSFHEKNLQKIAPESEQKMEKIKTFVIKRGGEEESHLPFSIFPPGGGPRLDRWARIQSGRVNFGVFSTSRFVPSALSSDFFTTMYFSPTLLQFSLTFHLLFCTFDVLLG